MKVTVNIPDELLEAIDEKAKSMYLSRSAYVTMTLSQRLQQDKVLDNMPEMLQVLKDLKPLSDKQ